MKPISRTAAGGSHRQPRAGTNYPATVLVAISSANVEGPRANASPQRERNREYPEGSQARASDRRRDPETPHQSQDLLPLEGQVRRGSIRGTPPVAPPEVGKREAQAVGGQASARDRDPE